MSELVVIAGMSGAGRSVAANNLEDLGWFVMDNLPPSLIPKVAELADSSGPTGDRLALVVGSGRYHDEIVSLIGGLRNQVDRLQLVFLDASTEVLVRRYESTRRRHPFADVSTRGTLSDSIEAERVALESLRAEADIMIDTSDFNVHQLRERMLEIFVSGGAAPTMRTTVLSFGYKHGMPLDVDLVLDCRFLPNPHWVEDLRLKSGLEEPVAKYVLEQPVTGAFLARLERLLALILPFYVQEGKSYLTIAFGCTGGRHRSVAIAEKMAQTLDRLGHAPAIVHRDVEK
ncbi:MAG: RNase adapter RapZ [Acidimicrobiaceae bacterium]|jgi:RNase adapter protein RapZ|nr:RNase adapter RapZ [Acidimicrobiaceae bacterium]MBT5580393.1 RNase adapter RapZ [Acidimicrobiaceae bacterium]MBT5849600.1 RNase adapter RapZ [Acidimicrobiaceae bacterium]